MVVLAFAYPRSSIETCVCDLSADFTFGFRHMPRGTY